MQRGSALPILLLFIIIAITAFGSIYLLSGINKPQATVISKTQETVQQITEVVEQKAENPIHIPKAIAAENTNLNFSSNQLKFEFSYPNALSVVEETEKEFNERENGEYRKNFKGYIGYEMAKFLGAVVILDGKKSLDEVTSSAYETNPLTIWVFENPENLSIEKWFDSFWYYPFVWGDFTSRRNNIAPINEIVIGGQASKFGIVTYRPGEPKFIYTPYGGKMFMFRVVGESGDQILQTLKFSN